MITNEESTPRVGRPSSFERDELVAAALELGPDSLALRTVADALGVPRTTVYNHVRSPEELGRLALSSLLESLEGPAPEPLEGAHWQAQLEAFAERKRNELLAAAPWLRYYDPDVHISRATLREANRLIELLVKARFSAEAAGSALSLIACVVDESVRVHGRNLSSATGEPAYLSRLSEKEFPWIAAAQGTHDPDGEEERFVYNLRCTLAGIAAVGRASSRSGQFETRGRSASTGWSRTRRRSGSAPAS